MQDHHPYLRDGNILLECQIAIDGDQVRETGLTQGSKQSPIPAAEPTFISHGRDADLG